MRTKVIKDLSGYIFENRKPTESHSFGKTPTFEVEAILQRANTPNKNGRIYPTSVLKRQFDLYKEKVIEKNAYGELDHSDDDLMVKLKNVSHIITDMEWKGDEWLGKLKILDTPFGKIAKTLFLEGCRIGISSRGEGSVIQEGNHFIVADDFILICFDLVSDPSTHNAYLHKFDVLTESVSPERLLEKVEYASRWQKVNYMILDVLKL